MSTTNPESEVAPPGRGEPSRASLWGLSLGLLIAWAGYFGPWVAHKAAGLVITGPDLAEYVKFLGEVRAGSLALWRESLLLPAGALSLSMALVAVNRRLSFRWFVAAALALLSLLAALSILPPAWSPALLVTPEFRKQTILMVLCLATLAASPLLRALPPRPLLGAAGAVLLATSVGAVWQFLRVKPAIDRVYGTPPPLGWGLFALLGGALLFAAFAAQTSLVLGSSRRT